MTTHPLPDLLNAHPDTAPYAFERTADFALYVASVERILHRNLSETEETFAAGAWAAHVSAAEFAETLGGPSPVAL